MERDRVYLIGPSRKGPIKIGNTTAVDIKHRIQNLQPGYPGRLHCYGEYPCAVGWVVEMRAHELLKDRKIYGEWFRVSADEAAAAVIEARDTAFRPALTEAQIAERVGLSAKTLHQELGRRPPIDRKGKSRA